jgi:hypothetical protein
MCLWFVNKKKKKTLSNHLGINGGLQRQIFRRGPLTCAKKLSLARDNSS